MKYLYLFITLCYSFYCEAQLIDDFEDGDISSNPTWSGDIADFCVAYERLNLCADSAGESLLYSEVDFSNNSALEWSFELDVDFSPSNNNYIEIALFSSDPNLGNATALYYVRIGENGAEDAIELYQFDSLLNESILVCRGLEGALANSFEKHFRIRYQNSEWQIDSRDLSSPYYSVETSAFHPINSFSTGYFIIQLNYTSSNVDAIYFDTIYAGELMLDQEAATIDSIEVENEHQLIIYFSESIDSSALDPSNYLLIPSLSSPDLVSFGSALQKSIHMSFSDEFIPWVINEIHIEYLEDLEENVSLDLVEEFIYTPVYVANYGEIRFSEVLADPSPPLALPNAEFIEIFNASDSIIQVKDYSLENSGIAMDLDYFDLYPDSFLLLCKESERQLFEDFGSVMGISNWQTLVNSGDSLVLKNSNGVLLDVLYYDEDWYIDPLKKEGGWSLERIDYYSACLGRVNWAESQSLYGGSPGTENSIAGIELENELVIEQVFLSSVNQIEIHFAGEIDSTNWNELLIISDPEMEVDWNSILISNEDLHFNFSPAFVSGEVRQITIENISSCNGDTLYDLSFLLGIPEPAIKGDIVINEVLFNAFTGAHDFIEIYNASEKFIDLNSWRIIELWEGIAIEDARIDNSTRIIAPGKLMAFSEEPSELAGIYPATKPSYLLKVDDLPNFPDDEGQIHLVNADLEVIDSMLYSSEMHYSLLDDENGVSLERLHPKMESLAEETWISASEKVGFATPGAENSHFIDRSVISGFSLEHEVISPNNDGFNDILILHYELEKGHGWYGNMNIFNDKGSLVNNVYTNFWMENKGELIWNGLTDAAQKPGLGIYLVLLEVFNESGDSKFFKKAFVIE